MEELVFATNNKHKLKEVEALFNSRATQLLSLSDIGFSADIPETAETLSGNALIKARTIHAFSGKNCFADDTGLLVDALNGKPGVKSARYAGEQGNSEKNIDLLLHNMKGIRERKAYFETVIALIYKRNTYTVSGKVYGRILEERRGSGGFGYDPIFLPDGSDLSFGEMDAAEKNKISHRSRAIHELISLLKKIRENEN